MNKTYTPRFLALLLTSTPLLATTPSTYEGDEGMPDTFNTIPTKQKKRKPTKSIPNNWSKRARQVGLAGTVMLGGSASYQYNQSDTTLFQPYRQFVEQGLQDQVNFQGTELLQAKISSAQNAKDFLTLLQERTTADNKSQRDGAWQAWIVQQDDALLNALGYIFPTQRWNIIAAQNQSANIEKFIRGLIMKKGVTPLEAAYAWTQILHFIAGAFGQDNMKKIVAYNNHRFLTQLISQHQNNSKQKVHQRLQNVHDYTNTNLYPSIYVTCQIGGSTPPTYTLPSQSKLTFTKDPTTGQWTVQKAPNPGDIINIDDSKNNDTPNDPNT